MSPSLPKFGLRLLAISLFCGMGTSVFARGESIAHSDVPDLPSAVPPISGGDRGWERPVGKTKLDFTDAPIWIGDIAGEDIDSENAPPPALTSTAGPDAPAGGSFIPANSVPPASWSGPVVFSPASSSVPAPGALVMFGIAGAVASRRRR